MIQFQTGVWYQAEGHYNGPEDGEYGFSYFPSVKVLKRSSKTVTVEDEYGEVHTHRVSVTRYLPPMNKGPVETFTVKKLGNARFFADVKSV